MNLRNKIPNKRKLTMWLFRKKAESMGVKVAKSSANDSYYEQRIDEKSVLLLGLGKSVRGSMQYILNELNYNPAFEGFTVYVRTSEETDEIVQGFIKENNWTRTVTCPSSGSYNRAIACAKYLITEVYFPRAWAKKKGQVSINIWHGTPLKKLGLAKNTENCHRNGIAQRNFIDADYLLYPNEYTKKHMLASYKVSQLMKGKTVNIGYPRTGGMIQAMNENSPELYEKLAPKGEKLYAYMPTWKDYLSEDKVVAESKEFLDYMEENLSEDEILYVNLHHKVSDSLDYGKYKRVKRFPADVDSYKLLAHTEALVTDYSSVFYDYLALRKQIVLYCYDYQHYKEMRGTYMDLQELPFDKAMSPAEVLESLRKGKTYDDGQAYHRFCAYDSEDNAKILCSLLTDEKLVEPQDIPADDRKQVVVYSHDMMACDEFSELKEAVQDASFSLTMTCDREALNGHKSSAYPFLWSVPVMGFDTDMQRSAVGKAAIKLYHEGKVTFAEAIKVLYYDYAIDYKRLLGSAKPDLLAIYDAPFADTLISLSFTPDVKKIFFLSDRMYKLLENGDRIVTDAVKYVLPRMDKVYVNSDEKEKCLKELAGKKINIYRYSGAQELREILNKE